MSEQLLQELANLESRMADSAMWADPVRAQATVARYQQVKKMLESSGDGSDTIDECLVTIMAGAGGDDSEDFVRILLGMYQALCKRNSWNCSIIEQSPSDSGGYRSLTIQIYGADCFDLLRHESGVHRLIRISPFNSLGKRQTSFAMVEVIPSVADDIVAELRPQDVLVEFSKSGGPGGQNVNKRETAVRVTHTPTGITAHADGQRTQEANRETAMTKLRGKIYAALQETASHKFEDLKVSKFTENEWGSQIRTYTLHPYQLVKDHRTSVEIRNVDRVLQSGDIESLTQQLREEQK